MLQQVQLASTFFNKFFICCSYYHPRNKFLRNKNLRNLVWLVEISIAASLEFSNINKDCGRRKWTWPKVIRSTKIWVLIEYYKQIDQLWNHNLVQSKPKCSVSSSVHSFSSFDFIDQSTSSFWCTGGPRRTSTLISVHFLPFSLHGQTQFAHCVKLFLSCLRKY